MAPKKKKQAPDLTRFIESADKAEDLIYQMIEDYYIFLGSRSPDDMPALEFNAMELRSLRDQARQIVATAEQARKHLAG